MAARERLHDRRRRLMREVATEAASLFLGSLFSHDLNVSISLVGNHDPGAREICQDLGCGLACAIGKQTTAFFGLHPAMFHTVHDYFLRAMPRPTILKNRSHSTSTRIRLIIVCMRRILRSSSVAAARPLYGDVWRGCCSPQSGL